MPAGDGPHDGTRRTQQSPACAPPLRHADEERFGDFRVDFRRAEVTRAGQPVEMSAREFRLLQYFLEHRGATLSRDELLNEVWGYDAMPTTRTVDVHVQRLRAKLGSAGDLIETVRRRVNQEFGIELELELELPEELPEELSV